MKSIIAIIFLLFSYSSIGQVEFITKSGNKAKYRIEVPVSFKERATVGANIDLKFADANGASIITVVRKLPNGVGDKRIVEMSYPTNEAIMNQLEAGGLENVSIIKRGMTTINGVTTYFQYYTSNVNGVILYYHSLNQFYNGNMIVLTITCEYSNKFSYLPYINRITNSLTHK